MAAANELVNKLFSQNNLDRSLFKTKRPKEVVPKTFDSLIGPLGIVLSAEEKKLKTGLLENATNITLEKIASYRFGIFPPAELESELVLAVPRKVQEYVAKAEDRRGRGKGRGAAGAGAGAEGGGGGRGRGGKRGLAALTASYVDVVEDAMTRKRARGSGFNLYAEEELVASASSGILDNISSSE